ncbi:MAG: GumC family protein [Marinomonas sp.]
MTRSMLVKNVSYILWAAWRRRYLIIIPIFLTPILSIGISLISPKKYETSTTILFQESSQRNPFLEDLSIDTNLKERMPALTALLHSRHILANVAWKMELINKEMTEKEKSYTISQLSKSLSARLVGDNLIKIAYRANDPNNMAALLNAVSIHFVERVLAPQRSSIIQSENFLGQELESRKASLLEAEKALAVYKDKFTNELPVVHSSNISRLSQLHAKLSLSKIELEGAIAAHDSLAGRLSQTNPVIGKMEESIVLVMAELAQLRARYTDQHSRVQYVLARLNALEGERNRLLAAAPQFDAKNLDKEQLKRLWAIAANSTQTSDQAPKQHPLLVSQLERLQKSDDQIQKLKKEVESLENEMGKLQKRVNGYGQHEQKLNELKREILVRKKIFEDLSERHELASVTGSLSKSEENESVKLIDAPFDPLGPINIPLIIFAIAGVFGGFALGLGLAFVAELLDTSVRRKEAVSDIIDAPVLARIPPFPLANTKETKK